MVIRYKEYAPTGFDHHINFDDDREQWFVAPVGQNRDSSILSQSNFQNVQDQLDNADTEYEVHRFGHWGCGWFELILVEPTEAAEKLLDEIEGALSDCCILDEMDYYNKQAEAMAEYWEHCSIRDRIEHCKDGGVSIFAARRDCLPQNIDDDAAFGGMFN